MPTLPKTLTIVYCTSREKPMVEWTLDSLKQQCRDYVQFIVVSEKDYEHVQGVTFVKPKPTVWSGPHRLTKEDWWSKSNSLNTGICLVRTDWVAFLDDRSVLMPGWAASVADAMRGNYAVFGTYEKRFHMVVKGGLIRDFGKQVGLDSRLKYHPQGVPAHCPPEWSYGCNLAMPIDWVLQVNGYDETCDGISSEDCVFGMMLGNNGFERRFDPRMKMIEDRTPGEVGKSPRREDKGVSPNDKSHALIDKTKNLKRASHPIDLVQIRNDLINGKPWPAAWGPTHDWFDNQPISEM